MSGRLNDERLEQWKKSLAESGIKYDTDEEYHEAMDNLVGFFDVLIQIDKQQIQVSKNSNDSAILPK